MERQKNWGKGGLALEMTRGFDMRLKCAKLITEIITIQTVAAITLCSP